MSSYGRLENTNEGCLWPEDRYSLVPWLRLIHFLVPRVTRQKEEAGEGERVVVLSCDSYERSEHMYPVFR